MTLREGSCTVFPVKYKQLPTEVSPKPIYMERLKKVFLQRAIRQTDSVPGAVIALRAFDDFLGYNAHKILVTDSTGK